MLSKLIEQGERHKVRSIRFEGNTVFKDTELRKRIKVREAGFPTWLTHGLLSDQLVAALLNVDRYPLPAGAKPELKPLR